jgi:hypothetical protein
VTRGLQNFVGLGCDGAMAKGNEKIAAGREATAA